MAAMLSDSVAAVTATVVIVRTRPRAILLATITMRKSTHGFPFLSHDAYGAPLLQASSMVGARHPHGKSFKDAPYVLEHLGEESQIRAHVFAKAETQEVEINKERAKASCKSKILTPYLRLKMH